MWRDLHKVVGRGTCKCHWSLCIHHEVTPYVKRWNGVCFLSIFAADRYVTVFKFENFAITLIVGILPGAQAFSLYGCIYRENAKAAKKNVTILSVFDSSKAVQMLDKRLRLWSTLPHNWASMKSSAH